MIQFTTFIFKKCKTTKLAKLEFLYYVLLIWPKCFYVTPDKNYLAGKHSGSWVFDKLQSTFDIFVSFFALILASFGLLHKNVCSPFDFTDYHLMPHCAGNFVERTPPASTTATEPPGIILAASKRPKDQKTKYHFQNPHHRPLPQNTNVASESCIKKDQKIKHNCQNPRLPPTTSTKVS